MFQGRNIFKEYLIKNGMLPVLSSLVSFQFVSFYGGSVGDLLYYWEQLGVFSYVLPFLLIFAIVFGILTKIQVFGDKRGINAVIALVVGLLALQYDLVPIFFSEIFPRLGVALSILLSLIILVGLFFSSKDNKVINYILLAVSVIIFLAVLIKTTGALGFYSAYWWYINWPSILIGIVVIGIFFAVISSVGGGRKVPELKMNWGE